MSYAVPSKYKMHFDDEIGNSDSLTSYALYFLHFYLVTAMLVENEVQK